MYYVGAAYYPELWDKSEIDLDVKRMKEYGINCVRVGEFAWSTMEKREGEFDFSIFKYVLDKMYENGIYTIMCTPSCTPPRWLFEKYPDAMRLDAIAYAPQRAPVHSRCHPCKSHKGVREKNYIIAEKMAEALGKHPGLIGWQIDNELFPYAGGCHCERCAQGFRDYLKEKYNDIDTLNKLWGMYRWSLDYSSFEQIMPPVENTWEHPSRQVEWLRFQNKLLYSYVSEQAEAIRKHSSAPIGTDMMTENQLSYSEMNKSLDVVQHNHYETRENLYQALFNFDFMRPLKNKPFWVTETQPGWNGGASACNGYRNQGACYINSLAPIAKGGEMNLYWLFRSHPTGHELGHGAVFSTAGKPNSIAPAVKRLALDLKKAKSFLSNTRVKSRLALTYSSTAMINLLYAPLVEEIDRDTRIKFTNKFYDAFRHYNIDVIETDHSLDEYEVIFSPLLTTLDVDGFKERIVEWVKNGGTWIVGPLSDVMTEYARKYTDKPYSILEELCGVKTVYQMPIEDESFLAVWEKDGTSFDVSISADAFKLNGAECLATYKGTDIDGLCAIARNKVGKGEVILLGTAPDKNALRSLVKVAPNAVASENISLTERSGEENGLIVLEIEGKDGYVELPCEYYDILNERTLSGRVELAPYSALILRRAK